MEAWWRVRGRRVERGHTGFDDPPAEHGTLRRPATHPLPRASVRHHLRALRENRRTGILRRLSVSICGTLPCTAAMHVVYQITRHLLIRNVETAKLLVVHPPVSRVRRHKCHYAAPCHAAWAARAPAFEVEALDVHTHACTHVHAHAHAHVPAHVYACAFVHTSAHVYAHVHAKAFEVEVLDGGDGVEYPEGLQVCAATARHASTSAVWRGAARRGAALCHNVLRIRRREWMAAPLWRWTLMPRLRWYIVMAMAYVVMACTVMAVVVPLRHRRVRTPYPTPTPTPTAQT